MKYILLLFVFILGCTSSAKETEVYSHAEDQTVFNFTEVGNLHQIKSAKMRRKAIKRIMASSVSIQVEIDLGEYGPPGLVLNTIGSGTLIKHKGNTFVITARHVALAQTPNPKRYACSTVTEHCTLLSDSMLIELQLRPSLSKDFALYLVDGALPGTFPTVISDDNPFIGDPIWISGMPWGHHPWISGGSIAWLFGEGKDKLLGIDSFAASGSSGGGVFNTNGELIGITVAIEVSPLLGPQVNQVLAVPIKNIWVLN